MDSIESRIDGAFNGYDDGAVFKLANGQVWQQKRHKYKYRYKYRPHVRIYREGSDYMMAVDCIEEPVAVVQVSLLEDGQIVSDFRGFSKGAQFQFQNGHVWVPAEYKYNYHYSHRLHAVVVDGVNGVVLSVEGMSETLSVRKA